MLYFLYMRRSVLFFLGIIALVFVSRFLFERAHLYDEFIWLDIPMHVIGGFLAYGFLVNLSIKKKKLSFLMILSLFLLGATLWELNEYFVRGVVQKSWYGFFDTVKDYVDGVIGLLCAHYYFHKKV